MDVRTSAVQALDVIFFTKDVFQKIHQIENLIYHSTDNCQNIYNNLQKWLQRKYLLSAMFSFSCTSCSSGEFTTEHSECANTSLYPFQHCTTIKLAQVTMPIIHVITGPFFQRWFSNNFYILFVTFILLWVQNIENMRLIVLKRIW